MRSLSIYRRDSGREKSKCVAVFKYVHKFFHILSSRDGTHFPFPWVWADLVAYFWQRVYGRSDGVCFLRLGLKWHCSFLLDFLLGSLALEKADCHVVRTLKQPNGNISSILIWLDLCMILNKLRLFSPPNSAWLAQSLLLGLLQLWNEITPNPKSFKS